MAGSPLDIFEDESALPPDPSVRRGIGAILGLAAVIAGVTLLVGTVVVMGSIGLIRLFFTPAQVDVVSFTQLSCRQSAGTVVVSVTISHGVAFDEDFFVGLRGWDPESVPFETDLADDADSLAPGDRVTFSAPADRADEITGVQMGIWRGEPGYAQIVPLNVRVGDGGCVASTDP